MDCGAHCKWYSPDDRDVPIVGRMHFRFYWQEGGFVDVEAVEDLSSCEAALAARIRDGSVVDVDCVLRLLFIFVKFFEVCD